MEFDLSKGLLGGLMGAGLGLLAGIPAGILVSLIFYAAIPGFGDTGLILMSVSLAICAIFGGFIYGAMRAGQPKE